LKGASWGQRPEEKEKGEGEGRFPRVDPKELKIQNVSFTTHAGAEGREEKRGQEKGRHMCRDMIARGPRDLQNNIRSIYRR